MQEKLEACPEPVKGFILSLSKEPALSLSKGFVTGPAGMRALVRLGGKQSRAVKVRFLAVTNREVSKHNCVVVTRGGEQCGENGQSVTQASRQGEST